MTWSKLDPHLQALCTRELTAKQLDVLKLRLASCGIDRIAIMLNLHTSTVREHSRLAERKLAEHGYHARYEQGVYRITRDQENAA